MGTLLAGKTVIITGAGRGIGLATALHLHDEGAQVVATVRSPEHLTQLKVDDDRLIGRVVDVTDEEQVKDLIRVTVERFGKLDGIVNNAGILIPGTILDATVADFQKTFDVNVKGVFLGSKYAIPELLKAGGGSIVNFGSINSIGAEKLLTTYTASKGAVLTLTKAIALDFGAQGIRANTVCPGFVDTPLSASLLGDQIEARRAELRATLPIGRVVGPDDIAALAVHIMTNTALTGATFDIDGGQQLLSNRGAS